MNFLGFIAFIVIIGLVIRAFSKGLSSGMRLVLGLLVFLPISFRIEMPGALPQLTIHRVLILIACINVIRSRDPGEIRPRIPLLRLVLLFGIAQFVSLLFEDQFVAGLKGCFNYLIEVVIFYIFFSEYVQKERNIAGLLASICYGLTGVALLATVEKYLRLNLTQYFLSTALPEWGDVTSTYPHRITMGYAMVMGVSVALALPLMYRSKLRGALLYLCALLLIGATYFSVSRGPWLGLGLSLVGIAIIGGGFLRKRLVFIGALAAAILIARPGVWHTIRDLSVATFDSETQKGGSYQTRWQLWGIAWQEIQRSSERTLFGYGPVSTEFMDLSHYFYGEEGWSSSVSKIGYTSWDNHYACDLIEFGLVGFSLEMILFASIAWVLVTKWREETGAGRTLLVAIGLSCMVFMFAMTNVYIFAPQLKYLFWSLVATGATWVTGKESACEGLEGSVTTETTPEPVGFGTAVPGSFAQAEDGGTVL